MDVVLIGGLWLAPQAWDTTVAALEDAGHRGVVVTLPGQGDGNTTATLDDQVEAVLAAVDSVERPVVVGHSAACALAWIAADRRPDGVSHVGLIGGFPNADGEKYAAFFPLVDGAMPFPGWEPFEGPDSADLDDAAKAALADAAIPVPAGVAEGTVRLTNDERYDVAVTLICPEFSPDDVRGWIADGDLPELAKATRLSYVDLDSGHWPMITKPTELARVISQLGASHS